MEKKTDLLRPFNLDAAKAGEPICWDDGESYEFLAEAGVDGDHAIRDVCGNIILTGEGALRMAPLTWLDGKPVYPGDVLRAVKHHRDVKALAMSLDCLHCDNAWAYALSDLAWPEDMPTEVGASGKHRRFYYVPIVLIVEGYEEVPTDIVERVMDSVVGMCPKGLEGYTYFENLPRVSFVKDSDADLYVAYDGTSFTVEEN